MENNKNFTLNNSILSKIKQPDYKILVTSMLEKDP